MNLPIIPPTLPEGICYATEQDRVNAFFSGAYVPLEISFFGVLKQDTVPTPEQRINYAWLRTIAGVPDGKGLYAWVNAYGAWFARHNDEPGDLDWYDGTLVDLVTRHGGSAGTVAATSGPFWEEVTEFQGRSPMHPGAIHAANPAKVLAVDEDFGEGAHEQTGQEVGPHTHPFSHSRVEGSGGSDTTGNDVVSGDFGTGPQTGTASVGVNEYTTDQEPMPIIHPVRGLYLIRRTARIGYAYT